MVLALRSYIASMRCTLFVANAVTALLLAISSQVVLAQTIERAEVVDAYPHDKAASTQGLLYADGVLYESIGGYGESGLRRVALDSGRLLASRPLDDRYFGEGLALVGDRLIQLTWKAGVGFVYDRDTLEPIGRFSYKGEGWGLTYDGRHLIMSDGSATLRFLDPDGFQVVRRLDVTLAGEPLAQLNELEFVNGQIWANVWHSDNMVRIDPRSGRVIGIVAAAHLRAKLPATASAGVLNGIAWDASGQRILVTGKNWPRLFEIRYPRDGERSAVGATQGAHHAVDAVTGVAVNAVDTPCL